MRMKFSMATCLTIVLCLILLLSDVIRANKDKMTCYTKVCNETAKIYTISMNTSANPCDDFYNYTCGGARPYCSNCNSYLHYSDEELDIDNALNLIYSTETNDSIYLQRLKTYFTSCLNSSDSADRETFSDILSKFGFDLEAPYWNQTVAPFDWINTTNILIDRGFFDHFLLNIQVERSSESETKSSVLKLTNNFHTTHKNNWLLVTSLVNESLHSIHELYDDEYNISPTMRFLFDEAFLKVLDFEQQLLMIFQDQLTLNEKKTIKQLSTIAPSIPWQTYVQTIVGSLSKVTINENDSIIIDSVAFIEKFEKLINETPKNVILNYIAYTIHISYLEDTAYPRLYDKSKQSCFENNPFKDIVPTILAESMTPEEKSKREYILHLATRIRQEFLYMINNEWHWMKGIAKVQVTDKIRMIDVVVAYKDSLISYMKEALHDYYDDLVLDRPGHWSVNLQLLKFKLKQDIKEMVDYSKQSHKNSYRQFVIFHQEVPYASTKYTQLKVERRSSFFGSPAEIDNDMIYISPAGLRRYDVKEQPEYLNLVSVGWDIAQMFADIYTYNVYGQLWDSWQFDDLTLGNYFRISHCFADQYKVILSEDEEEEELISEDKKILPLNLAFEIVHRLYRKWLNTTETQWKLPNHNNTLDQMFFISAGLQHCQDGQHFEVPDPYVFQSVGQNFPEFSEAFSCMKGTTMNPEKTCKYWI